MWALIPSLPRKWNTTGRVSGSDLGNNCFLFRFEKEEDLRRVLDNRPYHFAYWMVILQRWEPVISATFPSLIPFWITIKGLPLHYWQGDMVCRVGQELGTLLNHELTKTSARVKVMIDGLKPLVKESIVEFDSGEESPITLEYEKLERHCSICYSLLHASKHCPDRALDLHDNALTRYSRTTEDWRKADESRTHRDPASRDKGVNRQNTGSLTVSQDLLYGNHNAKGKAEPDKEFHQRVDRHGNPFGERTSTKQTRNAPPEKPAAVHEPTWRQQEPRVFNQKQLSPQYTRDRGLTQRQATKNRDLFPSQNKGQWRPKLVRAPEEFQPRQVSPDSEQPNETTLALKATEEGTSNVIPTREEVMEVLQKATRQYLSHPDPVEAAARRQRVHFGDANGQMEEAPSEMLAAAEERNNLVSQKSLMDYDPVTPPPLHQKPQEAWMLPDPAAERSPLENRELVLGLEDDFREELDPRQESSPARPVIRSIIVSPSNDLLDSEGPHQVLPDASEDRETLRNFQRRTKGGAQRTPRQRSPRTTPTIIRGASFKKRRLSQLLSSPGCSTSTKAKKSVAAKTSRDRKQKTLS